jgi:hypothetical protein
MPAHSTPSSLTSTPSPKFRVAALAALCTAAMLGAAAADAHITQIQITTHESPTFGGFSWPGVGQYEKLAGKAFGEVNPNDPKNSVIVDLALAPRNARGNVEYSFDFYILKPIDLSKGAHKVMYEPPNRGGKTWATLGRVTLDGPASNGNDPGSAITNPTVLANAFFMPRGYTMVWSGWDKAAGTNSANFNTTITLPVAKNPDGSSITGPAFEYIVFAAATALYTLNYPAANVTDTTTAKLTHRVHLDDTPVAVPPAAPGTAGWQYAAGGGAIQLLSASGAVTSFIANDIYEFSYTAKDPTVNGVGFAAVRDWNEWLRFETQDDFGNPNPLAGDIKRIYTEVVSQPARMLNDFTHLGFNQSEKGNKVFDAMLQWIGAGDGINMNYRWSQPGRTERNRQDHLFAEGVFPFANVLTHDRISGKTDSRYAKCEMTGTCPLAAEIYSANEYWVKAASLLHTDPTGSVDLPESPFARDYFISSHQHGTGSATSKGACQQFQNPLNSAPIQRALFLGFDTWIDGIAPPRSEVPRLHDSTMVFPLPQSQVGFPNIPNVTYTGLKTTRYRFNYGPGYYDNGPNGGIPTVNPPLITPPYENNPLNGPIYPSYVPITDSDGNDIPGVRLPDVAVPVATYTGWALRAGPQANDGCESSGQFIPFPQTEAARAAAGDPRPSVAERYPTFDTYDKKVITAMNHLIQRRLELCEDGPAELQRLRVLGVAQGVPNPPAAFTPFSFPLANSSIKASPSSLWPANNRLVPVSLSVHAPTTCESSCKVVKVSGNNVTPADFQITGPLSVNLRASKGGDHDRDRDARVYSVQLQCTDSADNSATKSVSIAVGHDDNDGHHEGND